MIILIKNTYDALIVGGGTGGAAMSKFLAQRGLSVAIVEKAAENNVHKICGDATSKVHFERVTSLDPDKKNKVDPPNQVGDEIHQITKGFTFYTPDGNEHKIPNEGDGWIIARDKFTWRLLNEARDAGVEYYEETTVRKPLIKQDQIVGINLKTKEKEIKDVRAKIVVDASGMAAIIRRQLDEEKTGMEKIIKHYDLASAHRELVQFAEPDTIPDPEYIRMYFDLKNCPGGYFWIFPRGSGSANVGLGVEPRRYEGGPRKAYSWWINHLHDLFKDSTVIHKGGATVPLRRPIDTLVYNGIVLIGDAGSCVKATDGGGIGLSLISASQAVRPIMDAIEADNLTRDGPLWDYNTGFMKTTGLQEAPLAISKAYITTATNNVLNTLFEKNVVTAQDLYDLNSGQNISMGLKTVLKRVWRGRGILPFLLGLNGTMKRMDKARDLYANYPDSWKDLPAWRKQIAVVYQDEKRAAKFYAETGVSKVRQNRIAAAAGD